jgi:WD40 repeat protein/serine/threonine protein kinase
MTQPAPDHSRSDVTQPELTTDGKPAKPHAGFAPTVALPTSTPSPIVDETLGYVPALARGPILGADEVVLSEYELLGEIARGGMGVVYKARHRKLNRVVALKVHRAGPLASADEAQRLQVEAEAAAKLDHPHIVPIYEVGQMGGLPYISMAFVEGRSLAKHVAEQPLAPREAAGLMRQVADAVAYAHSQGVIHRDLKPSNILLDPAGQPRVTDFGLAKRADADSSLTQAGQVMGTPSYMPPEQAEGKNEQVGPLSDVYSLGATLYCLVTGRPPFQSASVVETLKQVVEQEPAAPRFLNPSVDRDLDTICLKCLQKRPEKRYSSATALTEDLQRYLDKRPIHARPVGQIEKLDRWCRRNPYIAVLLAGIVGVFLLAFAAVSWSYFQAEKARKVAEQREKDERWERYRSNIAAAAAALQLQNSGAARTALDEAPKEHRNWEWNHLHSQLDGATFVLPAPGESYRSHALSPTGQQVAVCGANQNEVYLYNVADGKLEAVLRGHTSPATSVVYRHDGKQLATAGDDQTIRLWEPATGKPIDVLKPEIAPAELDRNTVVAYSPDGSRMVSYVRKGSGTCRLWDPVAGKEIALLGKRQVGDRPIAFCPDGKRVAVGSGEEVHLFDAITGRNLASLGPHPKKVSCLVCSSDGKRIATGTDGGEAVHLWNGENGREIALLKGHTAEVKGLVFSPDGSRLVTESMYPDNTARLWNAIDGQMLAVLAGHKNAVNAAAFSPDGSRAVTASWDQTARLWDGRTGQLLAILGGHTASLRHVLFSPDGTRVVTASEDATLRLWHAQTGELVSVLRGHAGDFPDGCSPVFTPDGSILASGSADGTVRIWDMRLVERNGILKGHESFVYDVAFSPDGEQAASAAWDGTVRLWNATTGRQTGLLKHETGIVSSVAYSGDGRLLAAGERGRGVTLWDVASQKPAHASRFEAPRFGDSRVALNPAGTLLAAGCDEGTVRFWDVGTGQEVARLQGHNNGAGAAFSPDGSLLATAGGDKTIRLWDVATRAPVAVLRGHTETVFRAAFSADGKLLASGSLDKTIRLWGVQTHEQLAVILPGSVVYSVAFSPDGRRLAAACRDNTIRLFDVASRQQVAELHGHTDYVHSVAWSPDGTRLVSGSGDRTVRIWDTLSVQERAGRTRAVSGH